MKRVFLYGLTASLMAAFVFSGCDKNDDDDNKTSNKLLLSQSVVAKRANGDTESWKYEYKYDKKGNRIEETRTNGDGTVETVVHKYNEKGKKHKIDL